MIEITIPTRDWQGSTLEEIYHSIQSAAELGFVYKATLSDLVKENDNRTGLWSAFDGPELLGSAICGSRAAAGHLWRHGDINVKPEHRRRRVGTAFYFAQIIQAILEGRRQLEDTIIPDMSPWMVRKSECGDGFLLVLGYKPSGLLKERTRGFKDVELWGMGTLDQIDLYVSRLPEGVSIEVRDTPKVRSGYEKNMEAFRIHRPELAEQFDLARQEILSGVFRGIPLIVDVVSDDDQVRDKGGNWVRK